MPNNQHYLDQHMIQAAQDGDLALVLEYLEKADLRAKNALGDTALMAAASGGHLECLNALLPVSDPRQAGDQGQTALMEAASAANLECVRALLPHSDAKARDRFGAHALWMASIGETNLDIIRLLAPLCDPELGTQSGNAGSPGKSAFAICRDNYQWSAVDIMAPFVEPETAQEAFAQAGRENMPMWAARVEAAAIQAAMAEAGAPNPQKSGKNHFNRQKSDKAAQKTVSAVNTAKKAEPRPRARSL